MDQERKKILFVIAPRGGAFICRTFPLWTDSLKVSHPVSPLRIKRGIPSSLSSPSSTPSSLTKYQGLKSFKRISVKTANHDVGEKCAAGTEDELRLRLSPLKATGSGYVVQRNNNNNNIKNNNNDNKKNRVLFLPYYYYAV